MPAGAVIAGTALSGVISGLFAPRPTANLQQPERDNTALYVTAAGIIVILIVIVLIIRRK
jgi:hypothetical protein